MPIYMDRHDVSKEVTAEIVADLHQKDLKIQHKFNCKGLTYWFDDKRKTAFCLVEAPDQAAIKAMHDQAHGEVPHKIIEVDGAIVESFLGRIEDPKKSQKTTLNIINDPAYRIIMVVGIKHLPLNSLHLKNIKLLIQKQNSSIIKTIDHFKGRLVKQKHDCFLISFDSVTNAVLCALEIHTVINTQDHPYTQLKMGLSGGVPVSEKEGLFEDTIKTAERLCTVVKGGIVLSAEVKDLYESENLNISIDKQYINVLHSNDEKFLNLLMDHTEREWRNTSLSASDYVKILGYSKSQLYRKMVAITGKSPNTFIKDYRLNNALKLLNKRIDNISEIAFETGFNSPAYFSKCFQNTFGILPSNYLKSYQH
ncbi:nickel-binding protein [Gramella sp. AN32]|uniref:Nickel-binding protein n=1 Tax=Christiangramia antarctica TaxID=2058158 RepID=A0ABW5X5B4_9FLAO|nr:nickel-binding protein [Gramella sp. AN32]MCM4154631.1 DUF4242 domain-containing protein [Gramella sp. AN32]